MTEFRFAKNHLLAGALLAAAAVGIGAFGAHALKSLFGPDIMQVFETANRYHFYHSFALILAAYLHLTHPFFKWSARFFLLGIILFSGSLYGLCFIKWKLAMSWMWVGAITPLGGLLFLLGWVMLARGFYRITSPS